MTSPNDIGNDARPTEFEFIVVVSGAGGATVAEALARQGRTVLVLERGQPAEELGTTGTIRGRDTSDHQHAGLRPGAGAGDNLATLWAIGFTR
jgi:choline dehydrogenase-like flavoprotein